MVTDAFLCAYYFFFEKKNVSYSFTWFGHSAYNMLMSILQHSIVHVVTYILLMQCDKNNMACAQANPYTVCRAVLWQHLLTSH